MCTQDNKAEYSVTCTVSDWVSVYSLTSHSTHNRSFRRWVFPGNQLHWYWQPKTIKQSTTYILNTKEKQKKTALANKTIYTLIWYGFYNSSQEMEWALFLQHGVHTGPCAMKPDASHNFIVKLQHWYHYTRLQLLQQLQCNKSDTCLIASSYAVTLLGRYPGSVVVTVYSDIQ